MGRLTAGLRSCFASPAAKSSFAPIPAPTPKAPATGATRSHLLAMMILPQPPRCGVDERNHTPAAPRMSPAAWLSEHGCYKSPRCERGGSRPARDVNVCAKQRSRHTCLLLWRTSDCHDHGGGATGLPTPTLLRYGAVAWLILSSVTSSRNL